MKKIKVFLLLLIIIVGIIAIYSFINVSGREIKNIEKLSEDCVVTIIVSNDDTGNEEYILNVEQKEKLKQLLANTKYKRRMNNTIIGVLPKNSYIILADWNDNGKTNLYAKILGGEYIQFSSKTGISNFMSINDAEFEKHLKEIIDITSYNIELENNSNETIKELEESFDDIVEISISDAESFAKEQKNGITIKEAEKLCMDVLGDKAEENGFPISYKGITAVSVNNKFYYVMNISWLVNENHWSYIGNCFVSTDGQEIYDGVAFSDDFEISKLRWKQ